MAHEISEVKDNSQKLEEKYVATKKELDAAVEAYKKRARLTAENKDLAKKAAKATAESNNMAG
eukprot:4702321-Pleurochrysis_carterae.AAC.1